MCASCTLQIKRQPCAICLEDLDAGLIVFLPCGHCFHRDCAQKWAAYGTACPLCRAPVAWDSVRGIGVVRERTQCAEGHLQQQLLTLSYHGDLDGVRRALSQGADVDSKSARNATPLILAAMCGHEAVVRLLLRAGADVHAATHAGKTALWVAGRQGHNWIARLLLSHGAHADVQSEGVAAVQFPAVRATLPQLCCTSLG